MVIIVGMAGMLRVAQYVQIRSKSVTLYSVTSRHISWISSLMMHKSESDF